MAQLEFLNSAKRKLSEKAQAALDNPSKSRKRKNNAAGSSSSAAKKSRTVEVTVPTEEEGESLYEDSEAVATDTNGCREDSPPIVESADELENLMEQWISPVYAFFHPQPTVVDIDGQQAHEFRCAARGCKVKICRYTDKKDARSTSNLCKHVRVCKGWGKDILQSTDQANNADEVKDKLIGTFLRDGTIMAMFERKKGKPTYSHRQHTREETRWVSYYPFGGARC